MNRQRTLVEDMVADWNQPTNPIHDMANFEKKFPYNLI